MNASDILKYGDGTFQQVIADVPLSARQIAGVCGVWSVQDLLAHLASYETLHAEILSGVTTPSEKLDTPTLDRFLNANITFNDDQVTLRKALTWDQVLAEYRRSHDLIMTYISQIPAETLRQPGTLPWYGAEYSLDDYLVYTSYGHKREHSAQIAVFRDTLSRS